MHCSVDCISGPLAKDHMYMINHSLNNDVVGIVISDPEGASTTNNDTLCVVPLHASLFLTSLSLVLCFYLEP